MRRWVLLSAAVAGVGAAALAFAVARLNAYLAAHHDALATQASAALGRPVSFGAVRVSWRHGGSVRVSDLRIADDPRFGGDLLTAASAVASVSLLEAARGRWRIRSAVIDAPHLTLIGDAAGWNIESLAPLQEPPATGAAPTVEPAAIPAASPNVETPPLQIAAVRLQNGSVSIVNREIQPPTTIALEQVDLRLEQPDSNGPVRVRGSAMLTGSGGAASIDGTVVPGGPPTADVHVRWDPVPLAMLRGFVPLLDAVAAAGAVGGDLTFTGPIVVSPSLPSLLAGVRGSAVLRGIGLRLPGAPLPIGDLSGTVQLGADAFELRDSTARLGESPVSLNCRAATAPPSEAHCRVTAQAIALLPLIGSEGTVRGVTVDASAPLADGDPLVRATVAVDEAQWRDAAARAVRVTGSLHGGALDVEQATAEAFSGTAQASGRCTDIAAALPHCSGQIAVQGVQVGAALTGLRSPAASRVDGRVTADLRLTASGRDEIALRRSVRGSGSLRVENGAVHGVNLAESVLGALPGIDVVMRSGGRASRLLGGGATRFDRLSATLRIGDERVASDDIALSAQDFTVTASGRMSFAGALSGRGVFRGAAPLIDDISRGVPLLGSLAASTKGLFTVPFTVGGTVDDPEVEPDVSGIASGLGREVGAGVEALFGAPKGGRPGGVLRRPFDDLFGR